MGWMIGGLVAVVAGGFLLAGMWSAERGERRRGRRSDRWFVLRSYPLVVVTMGLGVLFVVPASVAYDGGGWGRLTVVTVLAWIAAAVLGGVGLFLLGRNLAGHDPDAGRIADRLSDDPASRQLLTRWLQRVRWRRWLGGFLGILVAVLLSADSNGPDLLVLGFAGIMAGSLSAELHHWRRADGGGARAADLATRQIRAYTVAGEQLLLGLLTAGALLVLAADAGGLSPGTTDQGPTWPWAVAVVTVVGVVLAMQWRIVSRPRPALPPELRRADDLARRLAVSRGVAQPGTALGLAMLAEESGRAGYGAVSGILWLLAAGFWIGTRRLGLDKLLSVPAPVAAAGPPRAEPAGA